MSERPKYRVVEDISFEDQLQRSGIERRSLHSGDVPLSDVDLAQLVQDSRTEAVGMTYRGYRRYDPLEIKVQELRGGRLSTIMSRVGLSQFIPYETKKVIDLTPSVPVDVTVSEPETMN